MELRRPIGDPRCSRARSHGGGGNVACVAVVRGRHRRALAVPGRPASRRRGGAFGLMRSAPAIDVVPAPGIAMRIHGDDATLRHFRAEYAAAIMASPIAPLDVEIAFVKAVGSEGSLLHGRHKTVEWDVQLIAGDEGPIRSAIAAVGVPRSFVLSLVQGYHVETLLALRAVERGAVLLPAAAFRTERGVTLLAGRSRSGKSTLAAIALTAGLPVFGD